MLKVAHHTFGQLTIFSIFSSLENFFLDKPPPIVLILPLFELFRATTKTHPGYNSNNRLAVKIVLDSGQGFLAAARVGSRCPSCALIERYLHPRARQGSPSHFPVTQLDCWDTRGVRRGCHSGHQVTVEAQKPQRSATRRPRWRPADLVPSP